MRPTASASSPSSATERSVASLGRFWREIARATPAGRVDESDGVSIIATGIPVPPFNGVFGLERAVTAEAVLAAVDDLAGRGLPWNVQLRSDYPRELDAAFADRGLAVAEVVPFMIAPADVPLPDAAGVDLRRVTTHRDIDSTLTLLEEGFEMPPSVARDGFPIAALFFPGVSTWLASVDGVDVSTALGAARDGVVGIYNVATRASHRGRGLGTATTVAAMRTGFEAGATAAYLQSSPMGYRVYERLGFRTVEQWTQWMPKEYLEPVS